MTAAFDRHPSMSPPKKVARWRGRAPGRRRPSPRAPENSAASPLHEAPGNSPKCEQLHAPG